MRYVILSHVFDAWWKSELIFRKDQEHMAELSVRFISEGQSNKATTWETMGHGLRSCGANCPEFMKKPYSSIFPP